MARPFPKTKGFLCYVDESGCEGFRFGEGSSDWFVLAAVVTRQSSDDDVTAVVEEVKKELLWSPGKALHWKKLRHLEKKQIGRASCRERV